MQSFVAPIPTIAAIATGVGGGVGIIRISGPLALSIGEALCHPWPSNIRSHHLYLTHFRETSGQNEVIDQGLVCMMKGPHSYTGEDVLELHAHGGEINLKRLLQAVLGMGATPASPGEFTKRAFLAGKLDLTQAEAIAALISAQSLQATRQSQRQLSGELGKTISNLRKRVLYFLGALEGSLDFPDVEDDEHLIQESGQELVSLQIQLKKLANSFTQGGKVLTHGIEVVLFGRTNAGKSSLLNALCEAERVLVDAEPGTTRDFVEIRTEFRGIPVTLIDTAGARRAATRLEQQGLRLGKQRGLHADVVLLVVDGLWGIGEEEIRILSEIPEQIPSFIVFNKMDRQGFLLPTSFPILESLDAHITRRLSSENLLPCSALCGWGLDTLKEKILQTLAPYFAEETVVMNTRQAGLLSQAADRLQGAIDNLTAQNSLDLIAAELRIAAALLGELTGEEVTESVVDEIFAQFCIGK